MKILFVHNYYLYSGGEDIYLKSLIYILKKNGHKIIVFSKNSKNIRTFGDKVKAAFGLFYSSLIDKELTLLIKKEEPDIAHFHNIYPLIGATAYNTCHRLGVPIIQHIHNYQSVCPKSSLFRNGKICELCPKSKSLLPSLFFSCYHNSFLATLFFVLAKIYHHIVGSFKLVSVYISPSLFTLKYLTSSFSTKGKIVHIPNFVTLPQKIGKVGKAHQSYYLYVGRIVEEKGVENALAAFKGVSSTLLVIGDGPLKKGLVTKYKNNSSITFLPFQTRAKIYSYIKNCTALIVSSKWYEVSPLVCIEALLLKKPLIFRRIGALVEHTQNGLGIKDARFTYTLSQIAKKKRTLPKVRYSLATSSQYSEQSHYNAIIALYEKSIQTK